MTIHQALLMIMAAAIARQIQVPGAQYINETGTFQAQVPGGTYMNEGGA